MRRMSRAAGALKTALGRRGSIRSKILAGFTVILVGMLSINLLVIGLSHHFLGAYGARSWRSGSFPQTS